MDEDGPSFLLPLSLFFVVGVSLVINRGFHNNAVPFRIPPPPQIGPRFEARTIPNPNVESHQRHPELRPSPWIEGIRYITCFDPTGGFYLDTLPADNTGQILNKIARAADAQKEWKKTSFRDRRRVMISLKEWLVDNQETCARVVCRDTGKTLLDAALGEIMTTCSKLDWLIKHGEEQLPLYNAWSPIVAALFSGNAIVLKCSKNVVWSTTWFVEAVRECLRACGRDPELIQLVTITRSPIIRHITFIGSEDVGRQVAMAATEHLTPVTLELGGKDPAIILPYTNLKQWASLWMRGIFHNAGQNCIGIERLIRRAEELRLGSTLTNPGDGFVPTVDVGAMINEDRVRHTEELVRLAANAGLDFQGGERYRHPYLEHGTYFIPTVIGDVSPQSQCAQRERECLRARTLIIKYETVQEAIDIANGTRYGLGASCVKVARQLECGMVSINGYGEFYVSDQDLPFGGTKSSGYGRFGGAEGLRALTTTKAIVEDRFGWAMQTTIPRQLDYPVGSLKDSWYGIRQRADRFAYGNSWWARAQSLVQLIRASRR
ncbi:Aldehyde/histidinol dehydrogenase [Fomitopsis serialis]|uniref:Aldehyde/histidinol dehydrogenase n=1 Tax=Fomitopsis serialis TaxID=139415 RepID=UPI0020072557|nr:Aldehyde/histidinol dehydrogenase [Neoantrodia serialis]KAH9923832.1 Aldehyde/histidinol dehydrogenase [Neoantrodia serialis]